MSNDDLMLLGSLDQSLPVDDKWVLRRVEEIVNESIERKDVYYALNACRTLIQVSQLSGMGLAKFFYLIKINWHTYDIEDDFEDVAYEHIGMHKATVDRYVSVWKMYEQKLIPDEIAGDIRQRNIKDQIPIAKAIEQGYEIGDQDWEDLVDAPDFNSVSAKLREIKGKEPRKSALLIFINKDGTLSAEQEGVNEFVGYLNEEPGLIAEKAINRIISNCGILTR